MGLEQFQGSNVVLRSKLSCFNCLKRDVGLRDSILLVILFMLKWMECSRKRLEIDTPFSILCGEDNYFIKIKAQKQRINVMKRGLTSTYKVMGRQKKKKELAKVSEM